jgi:hypothetical protein
MRPVKCCPVAREPEAARSPKFALYRETLRATGYDVDRIVIAAAEFATMPAPPIQLLADRAWKPAAPRVAFLRHDGIYLVRCGFQANQTLGRDRAPSRWSVPSPGSRTCREDHAPTHRPQMSSGRLFLDRVARQQSPSPLHRHAQVNTDGLRTPRKGDISTLRNRVTFLLCVDTSA